tara:strand:+ start:14003 stop:14485 length:483 start_codon:yes stop_codon:yes gene_type:complete
MTYIKRSFASNYVSTVDTAGFTKQVISTTVVGYNGTEVVYTPAANSTNVIYEVNYTLAWNPDGLGSYPCTRVQYSTDGGSAWTTIDDTLSIEGTYSLETDMDWLQMTYIYTLNTWIGERKIRLAGRAYADYSEYTIGRQFLGSYTEGASACPHVLIYSVG